MSDEEAENEILSKYTGAEPSSFSSSQRLKGDFEDYSKTFIEDALAKNETYVSYKQYRKFNHYPMIKSYRKRELWEGDLIFFIDNTLIEKNEGFQYILAYIDVFTKNVFVSPIKNKRAETILEETKILFKKYGKPEKIRTDLGGEFNNAKFRNFLKHEDVALFFALSDRKAAVIERFNLTIQTLLYKVMKEKNTLSWVECLPICLSIYRNRIHSTIKLSPNDAEKKENSEKVFSVLMERYSKDAKRKIDKNKKKPKFSVGDFVRLFIKREKFQRGYKSNVSVPYYRIYNIDRRLSKDRYYLEDPNFLIEGRAEQLVGGFFGDELVKSFPPVKFELDPSHTIRFRGKGRNRKAFVKWKGWPDRYNSWINASEITKLNKVNP